MYQIPVYKAELEAGLGDAVRSAGALAYACEVRPWDSERACAEHHLGLARLLPQSTRAGLSDLDLYFLQTILVTIGWNKNDDVFDALEVWVARHTPEHKPFNYEHDCAQIIGHIISNWVMDAEGKQVPEDATVDDLPVKFHVGTGAVLYKFWEKPELQERMDRVLAEIAKGEWFVSMECLFKGFDYALRGRDGSTRVVARNEQTAFLTKHLRAYGGSGRYDDYTVGRLLRNIVFSGKGLVRKPANPESVILPETETFSASAAAHVADFSRVSGEQVYSPLTDHDSEKKDERNHQMATEMEATQKQLEALKAENEQLKVALRDNDVKEFKAKAEDAEKAKAKVEELLKAAQEALSRAQSEVDGARAESTAAKSRLAEAELSLAETRDELKGLYADQRKAGRIATAKDRLKMSDKDAADFVAANEVMTDEAFARQVDVVVKAMTAWVSNNPADGNTSFPGGKPPVAPKETPAPTAPRQTSAPAPMAGRASEEDESGEQTAAAADLGAVDVAAEGAALSTVEPDSGVNDVAKAIAAYFGVEESQEDEAVQA